MDELKRSEPCQAHLGDFFVVLICIAVFTQTVGINQYYEIVKEASVSNLPQEF